MTVDLVIDVREKAIIDLLRDRLPFTTEALDIGDILFRQEGSVVLIIERKTILDLKASIIDKRRVEQKERLKTVPRHRIMYLIEGDIAFPLEDKIDKFPVSTLVSAILNTQLRDGIAVYKTISTNETAELIRAIYQKLNKDLESLFCMDNLAPEGLEGSAHYCSTLRTQKKANITPEVWFIHLLCLIPQITEKIAVQIVREFPTLKVLMDTYDKMNIDGNELLSDLTYSIKGGKVRRIGSKSSVRIYNFFHGIQ